MEKLASYIADEGITQSTFARRVGISDPYLSQILYGTRNPGFKLMLKIEEATDKKVCLYDWAQALRGAE